MLLQQRFYHRELIMQLYMFWACYTVACIFAHYFIAGTATLMSKWGQEMSQEVPQLKHG